MMTREEILNSSRELVDQIYTKMSVIESCDTVVEKIMGLDVCFNDADNKQIVVLNEILNTEQLTGIREVIISKIHDNAKSAQDYLERLSRKPAIINPDFEQAVKEMEDQGKDTVAKAEVIEETEPELTVEKVRELYIEQNKTIVQVSKELKIPKSTLFSFIKDNGLQKPSKKDKEIYRDSKVQASKKKPC